MAGSGDKLKCVAGEQLYFNPLKTGRYVIMPIYENAFPSFQGLSPLTSRLMLYREIVFLVRTK